MHSGARQQRILMRLQDNGEASIPELAGLLNVSGDTIRRDLARLANQGLLQKTHGGAVALDVAAMPRVARNRLLPDVKAAIGRSVADALVENSVVMLDAGMTALAVAMAIEKPMTVITHSLDIATVLADRANIRLVVAGGAWDARQRLLKGSATTEFIRRYRADVAILGACAIHVEHGLTASEECDADVKRAMLASSTAHWLVSDHLKFGHHEPHFVAGLDQFACLYTDRPLVAGDSPLIRQVIVPVTENGVATA